MALTIALGEATSSGRAGGTRLSSSSSVNPTGPGKCMGDLVIAKMTEKLPPGTPEELAGPAEGPVRRGMRFVSLDALRGFALLGILMLNIESFAGYEALWNFPVGLIKPAFVGWHAHLDYAIVTLKWVFAEGKMRGLFSMLFGAGAVLLTERIERRGEAGRAAIIFTGATFGSCCSASAMGS